MGDVGGLSGILSSIGFMLIGWYGNLQSINYYYKHLYQIRSDKNKVPIITKS